MTKVNFNGKFVRDFLMILAYFLFLFAGLIGVSCWDEVISISLGNIDGYPWGWEGGGWQYENPGNYLITAWIGAVVSTLRVASFLARHRWPKLFWSSMVLLVTSVIIGYSIG